MKINAQLSFDKVRFDQSLDAHLVVSITAPTKDGEANRPPICVVPCIDVSGSMHGEKLEYAKRSAIKLVDHLKTGDYCGLITFETEVRTVFKPQPLTAELKDQLKAEIGKLQAGRSTNFSGGLLTALEEIDKLDLSEAVLQRVIMFTDGHANVGIATKAPDIIKLLVNSSRATVSAFGYGTDVDQSFLLDFAREGKGNYAVVTNPDDALSAFGKELGGLLSTYATNLKLIVDPLAGHDITEVVSDVDAEQEKIGNGTVTVNLPDILGEETRHLVFAVKMKEQKQAFPRSVNTFDLKLSFDVVDAQGKKERKTIEGKAKSHFVKAGEESPVNTELDKIIALAQVVRAQIVAEEAAKKGDFKTAGLVMRTVAYQTRSRGAGGAAAAVVAERMAERVSDQRVYLSSTGYLRSVQQGATRGMGGSQYDAEAAADLVEYGCVLSNASQEAFSTSFADNSPLCSCGYCTSCRCTPSLRPFLHYGSSCWG
jgi:Ca-activated chloride channel family protein